MLKYLNDQIETLVAREERSEAPTESALASIGRDTPRNLCGFEMPAALVQADQLARQRKDRLARIKVYRDEATVLRKKLDAIGIEPIAIITARAFDKLIAEMGLFTLRPSATGKVSIDRTAILALKGKNGLHTLVMALALVGTLAAYVVGFFMWGWNVNHGDGMALFGAVALAAVLGFAAVGITAALTDLFQARRFARRAQAWVAGQSWEQLLVNLSSRDRHGIPSRTFYAPDWDRGNDDPFSRQIVLPAAPADVIDKICRILRVQENPMGSLHIAAEANAISFNDGLDGLFDLVAINAALDAEARAKADPILYLRSDHAVAVIAQYGELPDERETIDRIVNSEHLL